MLIVDTLGNMEKKIGRINSPKKPLIIPRKSLIFVKILVCNFLDFFPC